MKRWTVLFLATIAYSCGDSSPSVPFEASLIDNFMGTWNSSVVQDEVIGENDADGLAFYTNLKKCRLPFNQLGSTSAVLKQPTSGMTWTCEIQGQILNINSGSADVTLKDAPETSDSYCRTTTRTLLNISLQTSQGKWNYSGTGQRVRYNFCRPPCPPGVHDC